MKKKSEFVARYKQKSLCFCIRIPFGVKQNKYQSSVQNVITADDLFKK